MRVSRSRQPLRGALCAALTCLLSAAKAAPSKTGGDVPTLTQKGNAMLSNTTIDMLISRVNARFNEALPKKTRQDGLLDALTQLTEYYQAQNYLKGSIVQELLLAKAKVIEKNLSVGVFRERYLPVLISTAIKDSIEHFWLYKGPLGGVVIEDERLLVAVCCNKHQVKINVRVIGQNISGREYHDQIFDIQSGEYENWLKVNLDSSNALAVKESVTRIAHALLVH